MGTSSSKMQKRAKVRRMQKIVMALFAMCLVMFVTDIVCIIVLIVKNASSKSSTPTTTTAVSTVAETSGQQEESSVETTTETTLPAVEITEKLPVNQLAETYWGPLPTVTQVKTAPHNEVRGIYCAAAAKLDSNIELAKKTDINAFVIDLKDETNGVLFNSDNEFAKSMKLWSYSRDSDGNETWKDMGNYVQNLYNLETVVQKCHDNGITVIGRIVCFNDLSLAHNHPEMSIKDESGNSMKFKLEKYHQFANPYNADVWDFLIDLAEEAISKGVDEIQFDYVRFPTISTKSGEKPYFGPEDTTPTRIDAINRFLQTARRRIQDTYGVPLTADVFGIILSSELDGKLIGQGWSTIGLTGVDAVCPMIYPSHYAQNTQLNGKNFDKPDLYPYEVMYNALVMGSDEAKQEGYATVRPYVQAFTASYLGEGKYLSYKNNPEPVKAQIKAINDAGFSEWILWNASADYEGKYN